MRGNGEDGKLRPTTQLSGGVRGVRQIRLRSDDDGRSIGQTGEVGLELHLENLERFPWPHPGRVPRTGAEVDNKRERRAPLDVSEKIVPETPIHVRALDESRDVGDGHG